MCKTRFHVIVSIFCSRTRETPTINVIASSGGLTLVRYPSENDAMTERRKGSRGSSPSSALADTVWVILLAAAQVYQTQRKLPLNRMPNRGYSG